MLLWTLLLLPGHFCVLLKSSTLSDSLCRERSPAHTGHRNTPLTRRQQGFTSTRHDSDWNLLEERLVGFDPFILNMQKQNKTVTFTTVKVLQQILILGADFFLLRLMQTGQNDNRRFTPLKIHFFLSFLFVACYQVDLWKELLHSAAATTQSRPIYALL